jgi:DNA mismatch repair protein MutL
VHGGRVRGVEPAAHPRGTTVEVEGLFYNAPARRKFLRSRATETAQIAEMVSRIAAAHPAIALSVRSGGRPLAAWPAAADWEERVRAIAGPEAGPTLVPIERALAGMRLRALASGPGISRATTRDQVLLVNARPVRDRRVLHAIQEAYATFLPRGRFPIVYLHLELPYDAVDVNVHPAKAEVRFLRPAAVHDLVREALRDGLGGARPFHVLGAPAPPAGRPMSLGEAPPAGAWPAADAPERVAGPVANGSEDAGTPAVRDGRHHAGAGGAVTPAGLFPAGPGLVPLAQYRDTYILASAPDGLVIVDQHAAHERILYERLLRAEQASTGRQALLFPVTLELTAGERQAFDDAASSLADLGFELEPFGDRAIAVRAVPAAVPMGGLERLLRDLLAQVLEWRRPEGLDALRHRLAARAACHAAITANQGLDLPRMRGLLADLLETREPMTCPHGRPAVIRLAVDHLEREFRRR